MRQLTKQGFPFLNAEPPSLSHGAARRSRTPLHSTATVCPLLMDVKHGVEEIHKLNWVTRHLQGRSFAPYIYVTTHNSVDAMALLSRSYRFHLLWLNGLFFSGKKKQKWFKDNVEAVLSFQGKQESASSLPFQTSISVCSQLVRLERRPLMTEDGWRPKNRGKPPPAGLSRGVQPNRSEP